MGTTEVDKLLLAHEDHTKGELLKFYSSDAANQSVDPVLNQISPNHWIPTAEIMNSLKTIRLEFIYGEKTGTPVATATGELGKVGQQMSRFLQALDAQKSRLKASEENLCYTVPVNLVTLHTENPHIKWVAQNPSNELGLQATAPIPLAALPLMLSEENKREMLFGNETERGKMTCISVTQITPEIFNLTSVQWVAGTMGATYGNNSVAGLLTLICSYAQKAAPSPTDRDMILKTQTPLMPRTDFRAMLDIVLGLMEPPSAALFAQNLTHIVKELTGVGDLENRFFNWNRKAPSAAAPALQNTQTGAPPAPPKAPPQYPSPTPPAKGSPSTTAKKAPRAPIPTTQTSSAWNLSVAHWLQALAEGKSDPMAEMVKRYPEPQIGYLGNKVEFLIGNNKILCPILEFRGVGSCTVAELEIPTLEGFGPPTNKLEKLMERIKHWHTPAILGL